MVLSFEHERRPPLPADIETAHKELRFWQNEVIRAREAVVKHVEKRELDKRSMRGTMAAMREENDRLREEIKMLRERINEYAIKDTPK